jgi:hypothetical protein
MALNASAVVSREQPDAKHQPDQHYVLGLVDAEYHGLWERSVRYV